MSNSAQSPPPLLVVLMGVSGSGKSTLGKLLAERTGGVFADADAFHSLESIEKMRRGEALADADRHPWLERLAALLARHPGPRPLFLACSALRESYRDTLRAAAPQRIRFVLLVAEPQLIRQRLEQRAATGDHFMPAALLDSQLQALEIPTDAILAEVANPPDEVAEQIIGALGLDG